MNILLSNDDGYQAAGIQELYKALKKINGVQIQTIAPEQNNSAKSNALTLNAPLYLKQAENGFQYINGTPADCVHLAMTGLLKTKPDLVVSGINNGANMGDDTIYSGTVGAAMEGYLFGVPAVAFSQVQKGWTHIQDAAQKAAEIVEKLLEEIKNTKTQNQAHPAPWLFNVNIPNLPYSQIKPAKICRLGRRHAAEGVATTQDPRGETMYWIGGAGPAADASEGTDFHATTNAHISITPLKIDLTQHETLKHWEKKQIF